MAEYIKKSIAIAIVSDSADMYPFEKNEAIRRIEDSTPAEVAPVVHGRWEHTRQTIDTLGQTQCANCGWWTLDPSVDGAYHYCPTCGAKMDSED